MLTLLAHCETSLKTPWFSPKSYSTPLQVVSHMLPLDLSAGYPAELMSNLTSPLPRSMPK